MRWLSQILAVCSLNLRTLPERRGASAATLFGVAGVVAVFVGVLSIAEGFRATMRSTGAEDIALVLRTGTDAEMMSGIGREDTEIIKQAPGILRDADGPLASAELFVIVDLPKRTTGTEANVPLRGVQAKAVTTRNGIELVSGRMFEPGRNELIAGAAAAREFAGLEVGQNLRWGRNQWTVVGLFTAGGTVAESELWTDAAVLQPAYQRGDTFQSVRAKLASPGDFQKFKDALTADPRLEITVQRESDYLAAQSQTLTKIIRGLGTLIAVLMGFGAVFGALNTMYSAVSARTREIGTLRALGFGSGPVVVSVLVESLVLAGLGGALGAILAWAAFDGFQAATLNWQSFSQVAFAFAVTPALLAQGIFYALVMGLVGGLFPAIRAARLPVTAALREL